MASLGELLSGALGGEYSMGRPLDEEERRLIEELRAQGAYVPQERKVSPFRYGAGTVSQRNLQDIRGAIQPEQKRRMEELLLQRGEQERQRMAREKQNTAIQIAAENQARLNELNRKQGSAFDPQGGQDFKEYLQSRLATPPLTDRERAELTVRQQRQLPIRTAEATTAKLEQDVERGAAELPTVKLEQEGKQDALRLAAEVRNLLPPSYAGLLAEDTTLGKQLAVELGKSKLRVAQSREGRDLLQSTTNQSLLKAELDLLALKDFQAWLNTEAGQAFAAQGNQYGLNIRDTLNTMQARLETARRGGLSGGLGQFLPPNFRGSQQGQPRGGGRTAVGVYSGDEEVGGQPARLTPPVTAPAPPPRQPASVPAQRGQRPVRQTQPVRQPSSAPVAPTTSPAPAQQLRPAATLTNQLTPKPKPEMFSPEWEAALQREKDNSYYIQKLQEVSAKIADMERRSNNPARDFAWYEKALKDKAMFERLIEATAAE